MIGKRVQVWTNVAFRYQCQTGTIIDVMIVDKNQRKYLIRFDSDQLNSLWLQRNIHFGIIP